MRINLITYSTHIMHELQTKPKSPTLVSLARQEALRPAHMEFIKEFILTHNIKESYLHAIDPDADPSTASSQGAALLKRPYIRQELRAQQRKARTEGDQSLSLARTEKRNYLARLVRVNPLDIDPDDPNDPNGDLVDSVVRSYDKDGNLLRTTLKIPSKLQAIEVDNRMTGHNEPEVIEHRLAPGIMILPSIKNAESVGEVDVLAQWEKDAKVQQSSLKDGTDPIEAEFIAEDVDLDEDPFGDMLS